MDNSTEAVMKTTKSMSKTTKKIIKILLSALGISTGGFLAVAAIVVAAAVTVITALGGNSGDGSFITSPTEIPEYVSGANGNAVRVKAKELGIEEYADFCVSVMWENIEKNQNIGFDIMLSSQKETYSKTGSGYSSSIEAGVQEIANLIKELGIKSPDDVSLNGRLAIMLVAQSYRFDNNNSQKERGYFNLSKEIGYDLESARDYQTVHNDNIYNATGFDFLFAENVIKKVEFLKVGNTSDYNNSGDENGACPTKREGEWIYPTTCYLYSSPFGYRRHPVYGTKKLHKGIDIPVASGTPVYAVKSGYVAASGWDKSYGNYIILNHSNKRTVYAHLSHRAVEKGDTVTQGQRIASSGNTGTSTGAHLHFEIRTADNTYEDPQLYLTQFKYYK